MKQYVCTVCGHIYDESVEEVKFEDVKNKVCRKENEIIRQVRSLM